MNGFGTKFLVVCLSGTLALPVGVCCGTTTDRGMDQTTSAGCCLTREKQPHQAPAKLAKSCCCQERANTSVMAKQGKRLLDLAFAAVASPAKSHFPAAWELRFHAFFETGEHSFQTLFCVWRC